MQETTAITTVQLFIAVTPPLLAIVLALVTRKPLFSISMGILVGLLCVSGLSAPRTAADYFVHVAWNVWNVELIVALFSLGALIGVVEVVLERKEIASRFLSSKRRVLLSGWLIGVFLFIDDYFSILLNGLFLRSFARRHHISKEKIAFVIHSLGVSACVLIPFSTWAVFIVSIVNTIGLPVDGFSLFVASIPFNFYAISLLLTTLAVIIFEIDLLRMRNAERVPEALQALAPPQQIRLREALLPAAVLVGLSALGIAWSIGIPPTFERAAEVSFVSVLLGAAVLSLLFAIVYYAAKGWLTAADARRGITVGFGQMFGVVGIMVAAWLLGLVAGDLHTAQVLFAATHGIVSVRLLVPLAFILAAVLACMTSSWATFAILIPVVLPLSIAYGINPSFALAAIISGGVFGDHMSPISSTSALTKAVSRTAMHEHFHSQLPYSVIAFVLSTYLFFLIGGI